jgi:Protein of unknown function (DUF1761)
MLSFNWLIILSTGILPLVLGAAYYHPSLMGNALQRFSPDSPHTLGHPLKVYVFCLILGFVLAVFMIPVVFHANHIFSLVAMPGGGPPDPDSPALKAATEFIEQYGTNFRSFKHGVFHGVLTALFGAWPLIGITAMFERKKWQYTAIHLGYWAILFALMGGIINAYGLK